MAVTSSLQKIVNDIHECIPLFQILRTYFFFSNWVDLLPNLTHFEKTISFLGKDLVQKNGLT